MGTADGNLDIRFEIDDDDDDDFLLASASLEQTLVDHGPSLSSSKISEKLNYDQVVKAKPSLQSINGFDVEAGRCWIYPTNYPIRDYQLSIVRKGLFNNTLVSLPTGLGKTFIAAVIMYNFYRWYPQGKIVFMAPTKPLVAQQIEACFTIMGIPQIHMSEMTGAMQPNERKLQWKSKRVFFLTPQIMSNDLIRGVCQANWIKCLVIDEAHKALGNHAYAVVVRELAKVNQQFRILALSATPGGDVKAVQQIITNLLISNVEIRTEESLDLQQYVHRRNVETVIVPLSKELEEMKDKFAQILKIYVCRLASRKVLFTTNPDSLSKFVLLKEREKFRQDPPQNLPRSEFGKVEGDFALTISLYHAYELLLLHGMRSFFNFLKDGQSCQPRMRSELERNFIFREIMQQLETVFGGSALNLDKNEAFTASKGSSPDNFSGCQLPTPKPVSHPKMQKALEIVLDHFRNDQARKNISNGENKIGTRVMVFAQYRDSVQEITDLLNQHQPLVKAMCFLGQSSLKTKGLSQKLQIKVIQDFRNGGYNTLVSTCVGEEGLDIGEVDLIVCYDAHKSPIRLVQRMGRTGRKREGRVIMLVTKGKEERIYNQGQHNKRLINKTMGKGTDIYILYHQNPRMIPDDIDPNCHQMYITPGEYQISANKRKALMDGTASLATLNKRDSGYLTDAELHYWSTNYKIPSKEICCCNLSSSLIYLITDNSLTREKINHEQQLSTKYLSVSNWLPWQNSRHPTYFVSHTNRCNLLINTLQFAQLQTQLEDSDDAYDLEMAPYLDRSDVLKNGETEEVTNINDCHSSVISRSRPKKDTFKPPARYSDRVKTESVTDEFIINDIQETNHSFTKSLDNQGCSVKKQCTGSQLDVGTDSVKQCENREDEELFFKLPDGCVNSFSHIQCDSEVKSQDRLRIPSPPLLPPEDDNAFEIWLKSFASAEEGNRHQFEHTNQEEIISHSSTPDSIKCDFSEKNFSDCKPCENILKTPSKEHSAKNTQDSASPVLAPNVISTSATFTESLYDTTYLLNLLETSDFFNKPTNNKLHERSRRMANASACNKPSTSYEVNSTICGIRVPPKCETVKNEPYIWNQYSNKLINFNLNDNDDEDDIPIPSSLSDCDIIPPSPDSKFTSIKQDFERISKEHSDLPLYLSGQGVSPIVGTTSVNYTSKISEFDGNTSSTPRHQYCIQQKILNKNSCSEAKQGDWRRLQTRRSKKTLNPLFDDSPVHNTILPRNTKRKINTGSSSPGRYFLDDEAGVSMEIGSDDEKEVSEACSSEFEESFINDRTQLEHVDMSQTSTMAMYLRTVRSPLPHAGAFKIKKHIPSVPTCNELDSDIPVDTFQKTSSDKSEYEQDSFCVDNDNIEFESWSGSDFEEQGHLEKLTPKRNDERVSKRKRIFFLSGTSSEEDLNQIDAQGGAGSSSPPPVARPESGLRINVDNKAQNSVESAKSSSPSSIAEISPVDFNLSLCHQKANISSKPVVSTSHCAPVILVDSRELAGAHTVISDLRLRHHCEVTVVSLGSCDYIVSNRMAVERMLYSDVANNALRRKLLSRIRQMFAIYEKSCLIIEVDAVKSTEKSRKEFHSKYYANTLACLSHTPIKLLFSNSQEHTANILFDIMKQEQQKNFSINLPGDLDFESSPSLNFYLSLPNISFVTALNFSIKFKSVNEFLNSSIGDLIQKGGITMSKAENIYKYLCHITGAY